MFAVMLLAVTDPTGNMSSEEDDDSFCISNDTTSEDMSFTHLADSSMTPITSPPPGDVATRLIDLIETGVA